MKGRERVREKGPARGQREAHHDVGKRKEKRVNKYEVRNKKGKEGKEHQPMKGREGKREGERKGEGSRKITVNTNETRGKEV